MQTDIYIASVAGRGARVGAAGRRSEGDLARRREKLHALDHPQHERPQGNAEHPLPQVQGAVEKSRFIKPSSVMRKVVSSASPLIFSSR